MRWRLNEKDRIPSKSREQLTRVRIAPANLGSASALVIYLTVHSSLSSEWVEQSVSKQSVE